MTTKSLSLARNQDLRLSLVALQRAARAARDIAVKTDTAIVIHKDRKTVRLAASDLRKALAR